MCQRQRGVVPSLMVRVQGYVCHSELAHRSLSLCGTEGLARAARGVPSPPCRHTA